MFSRAISVALILVCFTACNDDKNKTDTNAHPSAAPPATSVAAPTPPPTVSAEPVKVELAIASVGNDMKYDKEALTVPAKSQVHLTLTNNGKIETMTHNWVLVGSSVDIPKFALEGLNAGLAAGYVPKSDDVIASTPLIAPGKTGDVTFTAPKYAGKYPYVCTFPGHYLTMKGVLTVTP
jgi:azurin